MTGASHSTELADQPQVDWSKMNPQQDAVWSTPRDLCVIARDKLGRMRWEAAEPKISTSPQWAFIYALEVLKSRWHEAEPTISMSPKWAYYYAKHILHERWELAEPTILDDPQWAKKYARRFLDGKIPKYRSLDAEPSQEFLEVMIGKEEVEGNRPD